jgi:hypothetical protein
MLDLRGRRAQPRARKALAVTVSGQVSAPALDPEVAIAEDAAHRRRLSAHAAASRPDGVRFGLADPMLRRRHPQPIAQVADLQLRHCRPQGMRRTWSEADRAVTPGPARRRPGPARRKEIVNPWCTLALVIRFLSAAGLLLAVLLLFACSSATLKSAGTACSADSECAAGLSCLALGAFTDAGCTTAAKACSKSCTIDSDCAALGSNYKCFADCSGSHACGATQ